MSAASGRQVSLERVLPWLVPIGVSAGWQIASQAGWLSTRVLPEPWAVLKAFWTLLLSGEIAKASRAMTEICRPEKVNIGALGNIVPQLHVHVIGRFRDDPAETLLGDADPLHPRRVAHPDRNDASEVSRTTPASPRASLVLSVSK